MPSLNKVMLIGHAGKDAEIRFTKTGKKVMSFSLATGTKDRTEWHEIASWDPPEWLEVNKGDLVFVEGKIQYKTWENKEGQKMTKAAVVGRVFNLEKKPAREDNDNVPF